MVLYLFVYFFQIKIGCSYLYLFLNRHTTDKYSKIIANGIGFEKIVRGKIVKTK